MGFKYIKREWKNGKWRYYYDDKSNTLTTMKNKKSDLTNERTRAFNRLYKDAYDYDLRNTKSDVGKANVKRWYDDSSLKDYAEELYNKGKYVAPQLDKVSAKEWASKTYEGKDYTRKIDRLSQDIDKRSKTLSGKLDTYMENNGSKIAETANKVSNMKDTLSKSVAQSSRQVLTTGKAFINSLFNK